jgi:hypothetical protein
MIALVTIALVMIALVRIVLVWKTAHATTAIATIARVTTVTTIEFAPAIALSNVPDLKSLPKTLKRPLVLKLSLPTRLRVRLSDNLPQDLDVYRDCRLEMTICLSPVARQILLPLLMLNCIPLRPFLLRLIPSATDPPCTTLFLPLWQLQLVILSFVVTILVALLLLSLRLAANSPKLLCHRASTH